MTNTKTRLQHASYWEYTGNHPDGQDCPRYNSHGYPMDLIAWMKHHRHDYTSVVITCSKRTNFGQEVEVGASKEDWDNGYLDFAKFVGDQLWQSWGKLEVIRDENGYWLYATDEEVTVCEVFPATSVPELKMIKKGHGYFRFNGLYYYFNSRRLKE